MRCPFLQAAMEDRTIIPPGKYAAPPPRRLTSEVNHSAIVRFLLPAVLLILFASGCRNEFQGTRLFTVQYPVIDFIIPAGIIGTNVAARPSLPTGFFDALRDNNVDAEAVDLVGGFRARIVSLDGQDFSQIDRIDLRACPVGQPNGCTDITFNLFSIPDNCRRNQAVLNLSPSLVNLRDLFVGSDDFRFEIVTVPCQTTSFPIEARLEWEVQAVGDLD